MWSFLIIITQSQIRLGPPDDTIRRGNINKIPYHRGYDNDDDNATISALISDKMMSKLRYQLKTLGVPLINEATG